MTPDLSDIQLLRDRDHDAWDALYRSACRRTYRLLHAVTGAQSSVLEELNQDVWMSAIKSIEQFDAMRGTPQDWVLGIARFNGLTYVRKQYGNRLVYAGNNSDLPESTTAPSDAFDTAERMVLLRALIASLPEHWQYLLRQKYEVGLSVNEISDLVGVTPKAVESTLSRARQRLRDLYMESLQEKPES